VVDFLQRLLVFYWRRLPIKRWLNDADHKNHFRPVLSSVVTHMNLQDDEEGVLGKGNTK
jgi:hypothetical protein